MKKLKILYIITLICCMSLSSLAAQTQPPQEYLDWLENLKQEMIARGISEPTVREAFSHNYYHPQHKVIRHDRSQNEFVLTSADYLHRVLTADRIQKGRQLYQKLQKKYGSEVLGVPLHYLVAFWGIETSYGVYKGTFPAIEALTVLSYDKRRSQFFREELYYALKILDDGHIPVADIKSSWAGAMGHFQFMPSTFNKYGKDGNQDGFINIWEDFDDALYSAANYLSSIGWKTDEPWGIMVDLPWNFDYMLAGRNKSKTIKAWKQAGINIKGLKDDQKVALIVPDGRRGQAYLVLPNFHVIMEWNRSENYALAVGLLADKIKNPHLPASAPSKTGRKLAKHDILKVQKFIISQKIDNIEADGNLGLKTRLAVQKLQKRFAFPADGYPDGQLLECIDTFSKFGYFPLVPPQKLHRGK